MTRWLFWRARLTATKLIGAAGQALSNFARAEPYGITSKPPTDATAYCLSIGGNTGNTVIIIAENNDNKPAISQDEIALWNKAGAILRLKANGDIHITGNLHITGDLTTDAKPAGYNQHRHTGDDGGNTSPPQG